jgi:hypothetical protein
MGETSRKNPTFNLLQAQQPFRRWPWPPGDPVGPWPGAWPTVGPVLRPRPWPPGDPLRNIYGDLIEKLDLAKQIEIAKVQMEFTQQVMQAEHLLEKEIQTLYAAHTDKMLEIQNAFNERLRRVL